MNTEQDHATKSSAENRYRRKRETFPTLLFPGFRIQKNPITYLLLWSRNHSWFLITRPTPPLAPLSKMK